MLVEIADVTDPRVRDYARLTDTALRRAFEPAHGLFIAEGELVVRRAVAAGFRPRSLLVLERHAAAMADTAGGAPVYVGTPDVLAAVTGFTVHRGVLAAMERRPLPTPDALVAESTRVAVLEDMSNPTNVGAVFRSAAALGVDAVLLSPRCADPFYRRAVRVSMGAVFALPHARLGDWPAGLAPLRAAGFSVFALTPDPGAQALDTLDLDSASRVALLLGAEGPGLSAAAMGYADRAVRIPMASGVDSLNVAAAAALAFFVVGRRPASPASPAGPDPPAAPASPAGPDPPAAPAPPTL